MNGAVVFSCLLALTVAIPAKDKVIKKTAVPVIGGDGIIGGVAGVVPGVDTTGSFPWAENTGIWGSDQSRRIHSNQWRFDDNRAARIVDPITGEIITRFAGNQARFVDPSFGRRHVAPVDPIIRPVNNVIETIVPVNPINPVNPILRPVHPIVDPAYPKGGVVSGAIDPITPIRGSGRVFNSGLIDPQIDSGFAGTGGNRFSGLFRRRINGGGVWNSRDRRQDVLEREAESRRAAIRAARRQSGGKRYY